MHSFNSKRTTLSALAAFTLAFGSMAHAASPEAASASAASADTAVQSVHHGARHHGKKAGFHHARKHRHLSQSGLWVPGYGPVGKDVIDTLALTDEQTRFLEQARQRPASKDKSRQGTRRDFAPIVDGTVDPHAAIKLQQERMAQRQAANENRTQKWLAVWDSLEPEQQQKVSAHLSERMAKKAERRAEIRAKRDKAKQASPAA